MTHETLRTKYLSLKKQNKKKQQLNTNMIEQGLKSRNCLNKYYAPMKPIYVVQVHTQSLKLKVNTH